MSGIFIYLDLVDFYSKFRYIYQSHGSYGDEFLHVFSEMNLLGCVRNVLVKHPKFYQRSFFRLGTI